ncbi:MAG: hypothetical protein PVG91_06760 [Gammaproteobacteria bacterium]|jgi:tetraacyldisaccharide-1-P 4'-kinase
MGTRPFVAPVILPIPVPMDLVMSAVAAKPMVPVGVMAGVMAGVMMAFYRPPAMSMRVGLICVTMVPAGGSGVCPALLMHGTADGRAEQEIGRVVIVGRGERARQSECQRQGAQCECACHGDDSYSAFRDSSVVPGG